MKYKKATVGRGLLSWLLGCGWGVGGGSGDGDHSALFVAP